MDVEAAATFPMLAAVKPQAGHGAFPPASIWAMEAAPAAPPAPGHPGQACTTRFPDPSTVVG